MPDFSASQSASAVPARTTFQYIESLTDLTALIEASALSPVAVFLHDPWCPISAGALEEMELLGGTLPTIDVSEHRALNREVEQRTSVRHESPQVIVLHNTVVVGHWSHGRISADKVRAALVPRSITYPSRAPK